MSDLSPFDTAPNTAAETASGHAPTGLFDAPRRATFLSRLAETGNTRHAAAAAGVSPQTAYRARRASVEFALLWDAALFHARSVVEEVLADRAINGWEEVVFYKGEEVGTRRRYDSRLLLAHLARLDRLIEAADTNSAVAEFEEAVEMLENGHEWAPSEPASDNYFADTGDDVPPVERALRWLEAHGIGEEVGDPDFDDDDFDEDNFDDLLAAEEEEADKQDEVEEDPAAGLARVLRKSLLDGHGGGKG